MTHAELTRIVDRRDQYRERLRAGGHDRGLIFQLRQLAGRARQRAIVLRHATRMHAPVLPRVDHPPKSRRA